MKKILIDSHNSYIRAAMVEDGQLIDLIVDNKNNRSITGNVYLGIVKNILPNQFAFIDIGQPKNGFLSAASRNKNSIPQIGQHILVQARKDPSGDKGASLSRQIDIMGRLVVLMANGANEIGVSHKIKERKERERLKSAVKKHIPDSFGVILRTASENKSADEILIDLNKQINTYKHITDRARYRKPPALIHQENSLLHDFISEDINEIIVDTPSILPSAIQEADKYLPEAHVRLHTDQIPLITYDIERQINRALDKKIWLKCGGFLIIEQTEACVIIDVNTGRFTGKKSHRESVLKTNLEAAAEAAAQIRLRNLSGMIIIDFINMESREDTQKLYNFFSDVLVRDRIKTNIISLTELGLMQLTRRKTRESLSSILMRECPHCMGTGFVKNTIDT